MKRISSLILLIALSLFTITGCTVGRKNSAGNLKIVKYDKASNEYTIEYVETKLDFGKFYFTIKNEELTSMSAKYDQKKYKLGDSYVTIGGLSTALTIEDNNGFVKISLKTPFKLVNSKNTDSEKLNDQSITLYVEFIDVNTPEVGSSTMDLIDSASIKLNTNSEDLLTFIRNKSLK